MPFRACQLTACNIREYDLMTPVHRTYDEIVVIRRGHPVLDANAAAPCRRCSEQCCREEQVPLLRHGFFACLAFSSAARPRLRMRPVDGVIPPPLADWGAVTRAARLYIARRYRAHSHHDDV